MLKLDMDLIRGIDVSTPRRLIVEGMVRIATSLGMSIIVEGVETIEEYAVLRAIGIRFMQGYLFARPALRRLPAITMPRIAQAA
jgi:EAL domain-containing protein (putative c-di-GMP-specific phosphodiesterase class I)